MYFRNSTASPFTFVLLQRDMAVSRSSSDRVLRIAPEGKAGKFNNELIVSTFNSLTN